MSENFGERLASIEATINAVHQTLERQDQNRKELVEQFRSMHKEHYHSDKIQGETLVEIRGIAESAKRHIDGHIDNHWKWIGTVSGIVSIAGGIITFLTVMRK